LLNVVPLAGVLKRAVSLAELENEGVRECFAVMGSGG